MNQSKLLHIEYTRSTDIGGTKGEITERHIIPSYIPSTNIKAMDVSKLSENDRHRLLNLFEEYTAYTTNYLNNMFNFNDWLEHVGYTNVPPITWRTFKQENMKVLD